LIDAAVHASDDAALDGPEAPLDASAAVTFDRFFGALLAAHGFGDFGCSAAETAALSVGWLERAHCVAARLIRRRHVARGTALG